jgi:hypothetical protein
MVREFEDKLAAGSMPNGAGPQPRSFAHARAYVLFSSRRRRWLVSCGNSPAPRYTMFRIRRDVQAGEVAHPVCYGVVRAGRVPANPKSADHLAVHVERDSAANVMMPPGT